MKILVVGPASVHVSSFIRSLDSERNEIYLLSEDHCGFEGVKKEFNVDFRKMRLLHLLRNRKKTKNILKTVQPDVVHIHQINRLAYFVSKAAASLGIPVIATAWGSDVLVIPQKNRFFRFLVRSTLKRSKKVTADARSMIDAMQRIAPSGNKYVWMQYGIEPVSSGIKENIVFSNRIHTKLYRIDVILRYFAGFVQQHPEWKLVVAGAGPETGELEQQAEQLGIDDKTQFVGWLDAETNHGWYARSRFYISLPESDGTSVSVLEAMSAGCIPILPDLDVSREWVEDLVNGVIEDPDSNPLEKALKVDPDKAVEINRALVETKATRRASTARFMELYHEISRKS